MSATRPATARPGIWWARACCSVLALLLASCATQPTEQQQAAKPVLQKTSFADLPGWPQPGDAATLKTLRNSCPSLTKNGTSRPTVTKGDDWREFCTRAMVVEAADLPNVIAQTLMPYRVVAGDSPGLFTGYYEPLLKASRTRDAHYTVPIYARPADLIDVDLGAFKESLKGQKIVGKVTGRKLVPYDDRAAIDGGALDGRATPLLWAENEIDPFFLAVQGSGRAQLPDGSLMALAYDGQNGHIYTSIGKVLKDNGDIASPVTMEKIRAWLSAHPDRLHEILQQNKSYVFFKQGSADGAKGAAGVTVTPEHSLAVDPAYYSYHLPLFLATTMPDGTPLDRVIVAQDTGGAITGPIRGDVFWGFGERAAAMAGGMQQPGALYVLLPKSVQP